jgi:hypothetical protein
MNAKIVLGRAVGGMVDIAGYAACLAELSAIPRDQSR